MIDYSVILPNFQSQGEEVVLIIFLVFLLLLSCFVLQFFLDGKTRVFNKKVVRFSCREDAGF